MSSRDEILRAIRAAAPREAALPEAFTAGIRYADVMAQFIRAMGEVGGSAVRIAKAVHLESELQKLPAYQAANKVAACVPGVGKANVDLASITDPHQLADIDFAVIPGELGVAESGAVWVLEARVHPRAVVFLAQHLAIVLPAGALVHNLHEAYARVPMGEKGFGMWLSGPSKTADIEQSLVIGAHGARSCIAILVG